MSDQDRYYLRVRDRYTDEVIHEYDSVFENTDESIEDVYRMIQEGRLPYLYRGYTIEIYNIHPGIPGAKAIRVEKI